MNVLSDAELRFLGISLLSMPSGRTLQQRIGASDLANDCDRCLAMAMANIERPKNPRAEAIWMQKEIGTGIHFVQQHRLEEAHAAARDFAQHVSDTVRNIVAMTPGARAERRIKIGHIPGYGDVYGTIDLDLPHQIGDWKSADRIKSALLHDYLLSAGFFPEGTEPKWQKQKDTKAYSGGYKLEYGSSSGAKRVASLSFRDYQEALGGMVHKMNGYHVQQELYMHGRHLIGEPVVKGSIIWINRDGNGFNDVPTATRYEDKKSFHDVWVVSFDYHEETALRALDRGAEIWARIQAGHQPEDFDASDHCFPCSFEKESVEARTGDVEATLVGVAA